MSQFECPAEIRINAADGKKDDDLLRDERLSLPVSAAAPPPPRPAFLDVFEQQNEVN